MSNKTLKIVGLGTTIAGLVLSLVTKWVDDKNLDKKVSEEVAKAISGAELAKKIES